MPVMKMHCDKVVDLKLRIPSICSHRVRTAFYELRCVNLVNQVAAFEGLVYLLQFQDDLMMIMK